jgi:hypothetical protein
LSRSWHAIEGLRLDRRGAVFAPIWMTPGPEGEGGSWVGLGLFGACTGRVRLGKCQIYAWS